MGATDSLSDEGKALVDLIESARKVHRDTSHIPGNISDSEMADEISRKQKNMDLRLGEALAYAVQQGFRYEKFIDGTKYRINIWHSSEGRGTDGGKVPVDMIHGEKAATVEGAAVPEAPRRGRPPKNKGLTASEVGAPVVPGLHVEGEELGED